MSMCDEIKYCSISECTRWVAYYPGYSVREFRERGWTFARPEKGGGIRCPDHKDHPVTFVSQGMYR